MSNLQPSSFWHQLPQPFVGLAPMDGITDQPFRQIVANYAKPDLIFTEFVNVEGLCHSIVRLLPTLWFSSSQRPIVAQLYGKTPEYFRQSAILVCELGFDGIDLNMGCPSKSVAGGGAGAGLIKTPDLAVEIIQATQQGVQDWVDGATLVDCPDFKPKFRQAIQPLLPKSALPANSQRQTLPVSVKTRLGYQEPELQTWIATLLQTQPVALTIHGRTYQQSFKGLADWELIGQVAQLAKNMNSKTLIIGNGDVKDYQHGVELAKKYHLAGVLIGRAVYGNPLVLAKERLDAQLGSEQQLNQLAQIALEHARLFEEIYAQREKYSFCPMRKHLAWYIKGTPQAKEMRRRLVRTNNSQEVEEILQEFGKI